MNEACMTISSDSPPGSTFPTSRIQEIMKENYRLNPNLKWQYFGKEDGVFVNYPSVKLSDCSNYDPRYRYGRTPDISVAWPPLTCTLIL